MTTNPEPFEGEFWSDPYPAYAILRAQGPREVPMPQGPVWILSRYDDVRAAMNDPRFSKDWRHTLPPGQRADAPPLPMQMPMMILMDPPDHTRLRTLVARSFTLRRTNELRPRIEQIAADLLDGLPTDATVDLIGDYAAPLPVQVICELLGVPLADRTDFTAWSTVMVDQSSPAETMAGWANLTTYFGDLVERKRREPDDALLSALTEVSDDGDRLSREELVAMGMLLLIAGHETTVNLVGNALLALLTRPEQLALLRRHPERLPGLVEEVLRWDSPVQNAPARFTTEPVELGGVTIPAGVPVVLSLAAANRDPGRFADADALRLDRASQGHLAFGHGLHHCLGAQLARIEGEVAIGAVTARFPDLALAVEPAELVYRRSTLVRGLTTLPIRTGVPR